MASVGKPQYAPVTPEALAASRQRAFRTRREHFLFKKGAMGCPVLTPDELMAFCNTRFRDKPLMIWGPPGIGKSAVIAQYAHAREAQLFDVRLTLVDPVDLRGLPVPDLGKEICRWLRPGFLPTPADGPSVLFLDELSSALPSVQVAAYSLVHDRRLGEYRVPDECEIIAAGNREQDRGSTYRMLAPLANRFQHVEVEPSVASYYEYTQRSGWFDLPEPDRGVFLISFLQSHPDQLWKMPEAYSGTSWPSPRSWDGFYYAWKHSRIRAKQETARWLQLLGSYVGCDTAEAVNQFRIEMEKLSIKSHDVLARDGVQFPQNVPDAEIVVLLSSLAATCTDTPEHISRTLRFAIQASRRYDEFGVNLVRALENRFGIVRLSEFVEWGEFQELVPGGDESSSKASGKKKS